MMEMGSDDSTLITLKYFVERSYKLSFVLTCQLTAYHKQLGLVKRGG